jgi:sporulation protein YlmC with PRC-barrel domain
MMTNGKIQYGARVVDQRGEVLGKVDHLLRNLKTGEIRKFIVRRKGPEKDLFISLDDVSEVSNGKVKLNILFQELARR